LEDPKGKAGGLTPSLCPAQQVSTADTDNRKDTAFKSQGIYKMLLLFFTYPWKALGGL
jgi:hypothetical protein